VSTVVRSVHAETVSLWTADSIKMTVYRTGTTRREACTAFWWGNRKEINHWGDPGVDGGMILTLWRRNFLLNLSLPCILNVNNTGTKQGSIIK
jgi:hypothetical protein